MYNLIYDIFDNYTIIKGNNNKDDYLKDKSIYFQNMLWENSSTLFYDSWSTNDPRYQGTSELIKGYIDFLLFHLSSKIDTCSIPFSHNTKFLLSKNLCYYFLIKQIIHLNITSDKPIDEFNSNFINQIYDTIMKKDILNIDDCKLGTYYSDKKNKQIIINQSFYDYFDLENIYGSYIYLLRDKDINSFIFEMKYTYPNLLTLKNFIPNYFCFLQLDFYSFSFGNEISKMIISANEFNINLRYLIFLIIYFSWIIITFIIIFISSRTIKQITEPIISLTEIIDLNNINEKNVNNDIFEYKLDDEINEFFVICKKIINGEIQDYNYKKNENSLINNNINNNMIINNKMILELIENQKALNNENKQIFLLRQRKSYYPKKILKKNNSSNYNNYNKDTNSQGLDIIKLTSIKNENDNKNSSQDLYSIVEDNTLELSNMNSYDHLLSLADYLYNRKDKEKKNDKNKLRTNIDISSTSKLSLVKIGSISKLSVKNKPNDNNEKDYKYITNFWYKNAKKNKLFNN